MCLYIFTSSFYYTYLKTHKESLFFLVWLLQYFNSIMMFLRIHTMYSIKRNTVFFFLFSNKKNMLLFSVRLVRCLSCCLLSPSWLVIFSLAILCSSNSIIKRVVHSIGTFSIIIWSGFLSLPCIQLLHKDNDRWLDWLNDWFFIYFKFLNCRKFWVHTTFFEIFQ